MRLIPAGNLESADPVLAVRWCLEFSEGATLREKLAKNVHLLIVIAYEGTKLEDRVLVPLDQMMTFINFRRSGKHVVFAKIFWSEDVPHLKEICLSRMSSWCYDHSMLNHEHTEMREDDYFDEDLSSAVKTLHGSSQFEVVVPKEHFPKEPSPWLKRLVNWGFDYPVIDQCQFRRRLMVLPIKLFFAGIGWFFKGIWAALKVLTRGIAALLLGFLFTLRGVDYKAIFHPWGNTLEEVVNDTRSDDSWLLHDKAAKWRSSWLLLCHPLLYVAFFVVLASVKVHFHLTWLAALALVGKVILVAAKAALRFFSKIGGLVVGVILALVAIYTGRYLARRATIRRNTEEKRPEVRERRRREQMQENEQLYLLLACRPTPVLPSLGALPRERQTFHLRFLDLKAKVCRPFAAG